jgi:hypothetical protein
MKILRLFLLVGALLVVGIVVLRCARAQSPSPADDRGELGLYEQLVLSLSKRGDSNTVSQIVALVSATENGHNAVEIVDTIYVLKKLRSGHTNDAIHFLEGRLDGALMFFGAPSEKPHDPKYDKILKMAEQYRKENPHKALTPEIDASIEKAFDSVPK